MLVVVDLCVFLLLTMIIIDICSCFSVVFVFVDVNVVIYIG